MQPGLLSRGGDSSAQKGGLASYRGNMRQLLLQPPLTLQAHVEGSLGHTSRQSD